MTNTQHTPGPWQIWAEITAISRNPCTGHTISRGDDVFICDAVGTSAANARLIAAAPDLLAALRQAYSVLMDGKPDEADDYKAEAREAARAAIAKATGQTI